MMTTCPACSASISRIVRESQHYTSTAGTWDYALVQCAVCGLGFVDPLPSSAIVHSFYDRDYGSYEVGATDGGISGSKRRIGAWRMAMLRRSGPSAWFKAVAAIAVETLVGRVVPATLGVPLQLPYDATIMDVGYGGGDWLVGMHGLGYCDLHGYDIAENVDNAARLASAGITLSSGDFLANDYPAAHYDCIRLSHVIEHLIDPVAMLEKCHAMLKPGGFIALSHPCFRSFLVRYAFDHTLLVQLPFHLFHHTPQSTRLMLERAGFVDVKAKTYGTIVMLEDTLTRAREANEKKPLPHSVFPLLAPLYGVLCRITGHGDFISAYGRRRGG
jgi:SAM-dependent methyltransferase